MNLVKREVSFAHNLPLNVVIIVVGWIYFAAWTVSFYPQVQNTWHLCTYMYASLIYSLTLKFTSRGACFARPLLHPICIFHHVDLATYLHTCYRML